MPYGDAPADPSPAVDKGKAKVDERPKKPNEKNLQKQDAAQMSRARHENIEANRPGDRVLAGNKPGQNSRTGSDRGHGQGGMDSPCPPRPPTQVEEKAGHVKGFVDQMLHDFKIANQERDGLQKRLEEAEKRLKEMEALHAKIGILEKEKEEMAKRVQFIQRPDLYELLTDKLRGHMICGHPYAIANWENVNLTCTRKNTTFLEDINKFKANMEDYPELKHALEQNKGLTKYKTDCSVCGEALGFLLHVEARICEHKFHFNCFWEYASRSRRCPICRVPYPREMYDFFCIIFVPEGAEVINRDTGEVDTGEAGFHPDEIQGGNNEVDIAARDENKMFLVTEVSRALGTWRDQAGICGQSFWTGHRTWTDKLSRDYVEEIYNQIMDRFNEAIADCSAHEALFEQMKAVFDSYVNPPAKADLKPFISGLDTLGLDVDRFLGRVPRATPGDEHTPSGEGGLDYIDELGPLTVARLWREFALLESQVRGHRPLTRAQARVLFHQAEQSEHSPPEEVTLAEIPMDHVKDIQSPLPDVASEPTEATQESSAHNSEGLEIVPYTPREVRTTVVAVEVPSSPESPRDGTHTRQEFDDWKSYDDLTKEDINSVLKPRGYVKGDVINMYIKAKFLAFLVAHCMASFLSTPFGFHGSRLSPISSRMILTTSECEDLFIA
ncbi:hypothetical protein R1flu_008018 [Riccia fluitans]|uniref:RING-type domain-containing protein n=1 Tax=Riccia fluitans TaxID=41844 RepID=A0ABD1YAI2_9MARC